MIYITHYATILCSAAPPCSKRARDVIRKVLPSFVIVSTASCISGHSSRAAASMPSSPYNLEFPKEGAVMIR